MTVVERMRERCAGWFFVAKAKKNLRKMGAWQAETAYGRNLEYRAFARDGACGRDAAG